MEASAPPDLLAGPDPRFSLVSTYPRLVASEENAALRLEEAGLAGSAGCALFFNEEEPKAAATAAAEAQAGAANAPSLAPPPPATPFNAAFKCLGFVFSLSVAPDNESSRSDVVEAPPPAALPAAAVQAPARRAVAAR